jgi:hypothetical protein
MSEKDTVTEIRMFLMYSGPKLYAFGDSKHQPGDVPWNFDGGEPQSVRWYNGDQAWDQKEEGETVVRDGMHLPAAWGEEDMVEPGTLYQIFLGYHGEITHKTTIFEEDIDDDVSDDGKHPYKRTMDWFEGKD